VPRNQNVWKSLLLDLQQNPWFAAYLAVGVVVALIHMYRENMLATTKKNRSMLVPTLLMVALLWPLIALSIGLNYMNGVGAPRKSTKPSKEPDDGDNASSRGNMLNAEQQLLDD
jgi:hypothetical protein